MRKLLVAFVLAGFMASGGLAQDQKAPPKQEKPAPTLKIGDPAPALTATKWLQGNVVKVFEPGKTYVVEFWATWCGPCIVMMPHLSDMQQQYKDKGVTFIGYSAQDKNNSEAKVTAFVQKRGPKLKYTFAYADDRNTYDTWMKAAGRSGIPCSFVVDQTGKIAYIGHPMYLDVVLPQVVARTWKGQASADEVAKIEGEVNNVFRSLAAKDAEGATTALKTMKEFETKHPELGKIPYFIGPKLNMLLQTKNVAEARKVAQEVMDRAIDQDDPTALRTVSTAMRSPAAKDHKDLLALSVKAAEAVLRLDAKDAMALFNMAETQLAVGDKAKAKEYGEKAVAAADSPQMKTFLEQRVKTIIGGDK